MNTTTSSDSWMQATWDKGKLFIKAVVIFIMALALWIPTYFIMEMIKEREGRQREAVNDITSKWAGKQTITGPLIAVPYKVKSADAQGTITGFVKHMAYFLPDQLSIDSKVMPEKRYRGIYEIAVYRGDIKISGKFNPLPWQKLDIAPEDLLWNEALLIVDMQDPVKGVNEDVMVKWNDSSVVFNPQYEGVAQLNGAFSAPLSLSAEEVAKPHTFSIQFSLNGSQQLLFTALGRQNDIKMQSPWADPGFTGAVIPTSRQIGDSGFTAQWKSMNRSTPQVWKDTFYETAPLLAGADLLVAVDSYDKTQRSVKYALLCIVLTFASFFLIETIYKKPLHLVQYALAGLALVLFYTLLLSISEYTGFNLAYLISAIATIGLIAWYVGSVMRSSKLASFICLVLVVVYGYIFSILQLQDYALLMGSIGLFVALGIIMYFSRKLQWTETGKSSLVNS